MPLSSFNISGRIVSAIHDSLTFFNEESGLLSNTVNDIDIDRKNGLIWVATDKGVSKYSLGHSFKQIKDNEKI